MHVRAALLYMVASRAVSLVVMAASFAILGRLLDPEAFGHFALAMAFYYIAEIAVQFGLRQYVISRPEELPRSTIAAAAGLSLAIAVVLCLAGLFAALAFGGTAIPQPVADCLLPISLALVFKPFVLGTEALLQRDMRFELLSATEIVRSIADMVIAVSLVLLGWEAAALGWALFTAHAVWTATLFAFSGRARRVIPRMHGWRAFIVYGRRLTLIDLIPKGAEAAMIGALSALQGMATVGLFNRAKQIEMILERSLFEAISPVILPALSRALRTGSRANDLYRMKLDYLSAICWPGFAFIALLAEPIVVILLGSQWLDAVPTVRLLALTGLGLPITKMSQKIFVALDRADRYLRLVMIQDLARLPLALIGAMISLEAFALAFVLGNWIQAVAITVSLKQLGIHGGHGGPAMRAVALTAGALVGPAFILHQGHSAGATLAASIPLAFVGWLLTAALVRHPVFDEARTVLASLRRRDARSG